jgi:hypothetical protein
MLQPIVEHIVKKASGLVALLDYSLFLTPATVMFHSVNAEGVQREMVNYLSLELRSLVWGNEAASVRTGTRYKYQDTLHTVRACVHLQYYSSIA